MAPPPLPVPRLGARFDSWILQEPVGGGGSGTVLRAVHVEDSHLLAAVKLAHHPRDERFAREAEMLSRLQHPHVPRLLGTGSWRTPSGQISSYLVMSWAEGVSLYDWARTYQRTLTSRIALQLLAQVARALEATHAAGAVHRDIKGDNVHVSAEGHAVLLDFGACWLEGARPLTHGGMPPGTEPYRSPQLLRLRRRVARGLEVHYPARWEDDLYALGVMAYRLLTGTYPPPLTDPDYTRSVWARRKPPALKPPSARVVVAAELERLVLRCLSESPEARPNARQLAEALEQSARVAGPEADLPVVHKRTRPPKRSWLYDAERLWVRARRAAGAGVLLAVGMGIGWLWRDEPKATDARLVKVQPEEGTSGLGEEVDMRQEDAAFLRWKPPASMSREVPREPLKGQRRPPCEPRTHIVINGGCWMRVGTVKPPCDDTFEHEGACYFPVPGSPRQPTSDKNDGGR